MVVVGSTTQGRRIRGRVDDDSPNHFASPRHGLRVVVASLILDGGSELKDFVLAASH